MARLKRSELDRPGFTRVKRGKGFAYLDQHGRKLVGNDLDRAKSLVLPPAWRDVWIAPLPNNHIQATGFDARGRKQYRYHDDWVASQDRAKFAHMVTFARVLPRLRAQIKDDLETKGFGRERVLAGAVRLLDLGFFRIGGEDYAAENHTYGLATIRKSHVTLGSGNLIRFEYTAKHNKERLQEVVDPEVYKLVRSLARRDGGGPELLAYKVGGTWHDVKSVEINQYVCAMTGQQFSAKDFRTWNATVLAAVALAISEPVLTQSETARKRAITRAVKEVSDYLGNAPAVARKSYIDPVVIDRFVGGKTVANALQKIGLDTPVGHPATQGAIERAVLRLLK